MKKIAFFLSILMLASACVSCLGGNGEIIDVTDTPATEPPATEPPVTDPPATEPPVTEPPATEPSVTDPPATEPPVTEPSVTDPPATEPPVTEPPVTEPPVTEPPATEPPATEPLVTEPPATEPPVPEYVDDGIVNGAAYFVKNSSLSLACTTFGTIHGETAKMSPADGDLDSIWYFERQADGTYMLRNAVCGYYLSVKGANPSDGAGIALYNSANSQGQHWKAIVVNGGYVLQCAESGGFLCNAVQTVNSANATVWKLELAAMPEAELPRILALKGAVKAPASCPEIIKYNGIYYNINMTGGMKIKSSKDLITWSNVTTVFNTKPSWIKNELGYDGIWAPGYYIVGGKLRIYYCASASGQRNSLIGLVDCKTPTSGFVDRGMVIRSYKNSEQVTPYNCIDPNIFEDTDGKVYLVWGSYAEGIYMRRIDPETGLLHQTDTALHRIADAPDGMEAPYLIKRGEHYYLFVAMGGLKKGTYYWAVGRSESLFGPYVDKQGRPMLNGNTARLTEWKDGVQGVGHAQPFLDDDGQWYMVSEAWVDRSVESPPIKLHISTIVWNEAGWPVTAISSDLLGELAEK